MGEKYIFKWANDSINEVFKPLWLNDTTYHLPNHINAEVSWYETLDLSTKISLISLVISILTFFAGFIISEFIRRHNKSHNLKQYKQFINEWVEKSNATLIDYIREVL